MAPKDAGPATDKDWSSTSSLSEDADLVRQSQDGDFGAFDRLVTKHRQRVHSMILSIVRNEDHALDVAQETFLRAWRNLHGFRERSSVATWLHRIAVNASLDFLRRQRSRPQPLEHLTPSDGSDHEAADPVAALPSAEVHPAEAMHRTELRLRIEAALQKLSPAHRAAILLREVEGLSYDEIATAVGCSTGTVMSRLFHARKRLQTLLSDLR